MNKRTRNLIILIAVLAAVVAVYITATVISKKQESGNDIPANETVITVISKKPNEVASVDYTSPGNRYSIEQKSGNCFSKQDHKFPLDSTKASSIIKCASKVECSRLISESAGHSEEYGLDEPLTMILITYTDGAKIKLNIGDYNKNTSSYYLNIDGENSVYLIDKEFVNGFNYLYKDLLENETLTKPDDGFGCVTSIETVFSDGRNYKYTRIPEEDGENGEVINKERWSLTVNGKDGGDGDFTDRAQEIFNQIYSFVPSDWVEYNVTEKEQLESYGLAESYVKITVNYRDSITISGGEDGSTTVNKLIDKSFSIMLGSTLPDSDTPDTSSDSEASEETETEGEIERYFIMQDGKIVYIANESDFSKALTADTVSDNSK